MNHLTEEQIRKYQAQQISPKDILEIFKHLEACEECQNAAMKTEGFQKSYSSLQTQLIEELHPHYEELADYTDHKLDSDKTKAVEEHVSACEICRLQLEDLKKLQSELQPAVVPAPNFAKYLIAAALVMISVAGIWLAKNLLGPQNQTISNSGNSKEPIIAFLDSGRRIEIDKNGKVIAASGIDKQNVALIQKIIADQRLATRQDLETLKPEHGVLLGDDHLGKFRVKSPVGVVVLESRPVFEWEALKNATHYQVAILDPDLKLISKSLDLRDTKWQPDEPLKRGNIYLWQVSASTPEGETISPTPPEPEAMFRILEDEKYQKIQKAKDANAPHLVLASLYAEGGLVNEARKELDILRAENPKSKLVQDLIKSLPK